MTGISVALFDNCTAAGLTKRADGQRRHWQSGGNQPENKPMKAKPAAKSKKPKVKVQDMKPKKDARGGAGKIKFNEFTIKKVSDSASP